MTKAVKGNWSSGANYDHYMGRWSAKVASEFLHWLAPAQQLDWLDVGCGSGRLSRTIVNIADPKSLTCLDRSQAFLDYTSEQLHPFPIKVQQADAMQLPFADYSFDQITAGLCVNFVAVPEKCLAEMYRVCRPGGVVSLYVWDYSGTMEFVRLFWDAAKAVDPDSVQFDEGKNSAICKAEGLKDLLIQAGLKKVEVKGINIIMHYPSFDAYWEPFFMGQGMLGKYLLALNTAQQNQLRQKLNSRIVKAEDGSITLQARAWAGRGIK